MTGSDVVIDGGELIFALPRYSRSDIDIEKENDVVGG